VAAVATDVPLGIVVWPSGQTSRPNTIHALKIDVARADG